MSHICFTAISYTIEFVKLFLVTVIFLNIRQSKKIYPCFIISMLFLILGCVLYETYDFGFSYGLLSIFLLCINSHEKKRVGIIILSYIGISLVDIFFSIICITIFHINNQKLLENDLIDIGINSFSLVIIIIINFIFFRKKTNINFKAIKKYLPIYTIGGLSLSLYLTSIQFMELGEDIKTYKSSLVIGLSLSSLVLIILCVLLILNSNENEHLKKIDIINQHLLESQKQYYTMLLEKENETKAFRHDIRKHLFCLNDLFTQNNYDELGQYLKDLTNIAQDLSPIVQTGNNIVNAILNDIIKKHSDIQICWTGMMPNRLHLSSLDLCTIFYNLLLNAVEALENEKNKTVNVKIKFMETAMMISISNYCSKNLLMKNGELISSKSEQGHGYGIKNVKKCVEKNGGSYKAEVDNNYFVTEIILPKVL